MARPTGRAVGRKALAGIATALVVGGCSFVTRNDGTYHGAERPGESPIAEYKTGAATIAITGGETIKLDKLAARAGVDYAFGSDVRWNGASGWSMRIVNAGGDGSWGSERGYLTFELLIDGQHRTTYGDNHCRVDADVVDADAFHGTATCKGVTWYDALNLPFEAGQPPALDVPKFDAEVTFEAVP